MNTRTNSRRLALVVACLVLGGCSTDGPVVASPELDMLAASLASADVARTLDDLRRKTAPWHNFAAADNAGYTAPSGCVDERVVEGVTPELARGMGFHWANLDLLFDDAVDLLEPELVIYGQVQGTDKLRLAGFDYFVPASETWPSPADGGVPPMLPEIGIPFTWSPVHGGWMFHIWPWWENPDGTFANWNPTVPLCDCELDPSTGACTPD